MDAAAKPLLQKQGWIHRVFSSLSKAFCYAAGGHTLTHFPKGIKKAHLSALFWAYVAKSRLV